jgi:hypothetical protein
MQQQVNSLNKSKITQESIVGAKENSQQKTQNIESIELNTLYSTKFISLGYAIISLIISFVCSAFKLLKSLLSSILVDNKEAVAKETESVIINDLLKWYFANSINKSKIETAIKDIINKNEVCTVKVSKFINHLNYLSLNVQCYTFMGIVNL